MTPTKETLEDLIGRFRAPDEDDGPVPRISLAAAVAAGDDPLHVLPYMASLGMPVRTLDDLLRINGDQTEEELHCFPVVEGVAVLVASDGLWLLFET